jgi:uncharacterized membrane protein HdeD (DUF308 family)
MLNGMARNWWTLLIRGILAVSFGLGILFVWPGYVVATLVLVFGIYGIADGVFSILLGIRHHNYPRWWLVVLEGVVSIIAGVFVLVYPQLALATLLYIIAIWAIFTGIVEVIRAIQLREEIDGEWLMVFGGVLSALFGGLLIVGDPETNIRALLWLFGGLMVGFGVVMIILSLRIRGKGGGGGTPPRMAAA